MKNTILTLFIGLLLYSCNSSDGKTTTGETIDPNTIKISEVVHESLSSNQIEKIEKIQSTFSEVYPISLEETITNFKRDQNPDNEIEIWLQMASAYEKYLNSRNEELDLSTKTEIYKLVLSRSMMADEEAIINSELTILTNEEAKTVLSYYSMEPDPIDVVMY